MGTDTQSIAAELTAPNRIRVETALSRFPIHRLSKKGSICIDFTSDTDLQWKVSHNSEYGEPGPHAYKVDTLIVNRRIDEAPRPLPEIIRLGTLREINRELGVAEDDTQTVKRALLQNASAFISAKIRFKPKNARDGREKLREIHYSRYSVVFNGEQLPDGSAADAVYIVLNPPHRKTLNDAEVRPLDYDYLTSLSPGAQRLYELLSFQVFGAIAGNRSRARLLYSEYCVCAPQVRYDTFDAVKKQMFKLHIPHRESGYITKIDYQQTEDGQGHADWEMFYTPGPKALKEYEAFSNRPPRNTAAAETLSLSVSPSVVITEPEQLPAAVDAHLLSELARRGLNPDRAKELLANLKPGQEVTDQLEYIDHVIAKAPDGKFHNPSGFYVRFIEKNSPVPENFVTTRKRKIATQAHQEKRAARQSQAQLQTHYDDFCKAEVARFIRDELPASEYQQLFEQSRRQNRSLLRKLPESEIQALTHNTVCAEIRCSGRVPVPSFNDFCRRQQEAEPVTA